MRQPLVAYRTTSRRSAIVDALRADASQLGDLELARLVDASFDAWVNAEGRVAHAGVTTPMEREILETEARGCWNQHKQLVDQAEVRLDSLGLQRRTDELAQRYAGRATR